MGEGRSYESHTSPEAALRLYQILKPLSTEKKLNHTSGPQRAAEGKDIYEVWSRTNHEVARVTARIRLKQGQFFSISCEHGAHGIIRILREGSADKTYPSAPVSGKRGTGAQSWMDGKKTHGETRYLSVFVQLCSGCGGTADSPSWLSHT